MEIKIEKARNDRIKKRKLSRLVNLPELIKMRIKFPTES